MIKFLSYLISTVLVVYSIEAININSLFKKGREKQAKVLYIVIGFILIYLLSNFIYDVLNVFKNQL